MDMIENLKSDSFNWDLYDYLLIAPEHEVERWQDCAERRFAVIDRGILARAKAKLRTVQFKSVTLKLDYQSYLKNKEWIDEILEADGTPLDGLPFESLTCYLDVKLQHERERH